MDSSILGFPVLHSLPEFAQTHVQWVDDAILNHLILCHPLFLLPSIFPSLSVFSNESALCISISSSNEYSGLISFMIDWFDLFAVQGTLKSLLQNHSLKASVLWWSAFFMVQLSHPHMTHPNMNLHWHIIVTQCPQFTLGFTLAVVCSVGLDECIMTCTHHYSVIQKL